jgi:hypothetical protein
MGDDDPDEFDVPEYGIKKSSKRIWIQARI